MDDSVTTPLAQVGTRYLRGDERRVVTAIRKGDLAVEWSINEFSRHNYASSVDWNAWVADAKIIESGVSTLSGLWLSQREA